MTSQIFLCSQALFTNSEIVENCIFDDVLYADFLSLNTTECISKVESFSDEISYICTFYFLNVYNSTNCVQFYYNSRSLFESHQCYSFGDELAHLFKLNTDVVELIFSFVFLVGFVYIEFFQKKFI